MPQQQSTPGYLYFVADFFNLAVEIVIYFLSFVGPLSLLWYSRMNSPFLLTFLVILGWLVAALTFTLLLVVFKRLLIGEVPTGRFLLTSKRSHKWMVADRLVKLMTRSPFRSLVTENAFFRYLFYRGMGMTFDSTLLLGPRAVIAEPWSLSVGKNVLIGADAVISGHKVERQVVTLENVTIGDNVLIGTRAVILPGASIGSNVIIGANSVVQRGAIIPDGETWLGNPAQKLDVFGAMQTPRSP